MQLQQKWNALSNIISFCFVLFILRHFMSLFRTIIFFRICRMDVLSSSWLHEITEGIELEEIFCENAVASKKLECNFKFDLTPEILRKVLSCA